MTNLTPNATAAHWSAGLVGLPWLPCAIGPAAFDCWGLVRHVQQKHYGHDLPPLVSADGESFGGRIRRSAWAPVNGLPPRDGDIAVMLDSSGLPHVGVVLALPRLSLLHAQGSMVGSEATGHVLIHALDMLGAIGLGRVTCWRHP